MPVEKKSAMWRNFSTWQTEIRRNSPHNKLSVEEMYPHGKYRDKSVMWRNVETNLSCGEISPHERCGDKSELSQFMLFCRKICFVAIYAVLSRNIFGCNFCAFAWRKIEPKFLSVEKKGQI